MGVGDTALHPRLENGPFRTCDAMVMIDCPLSLQGTSPSFNPPGYFLIVLVLGTLYQRKNFGGRRGETGCFVEAHKRST